MKNETIKNEENPFLPEGYETPVNGGGFMKLEDGENKLRILSRPVIGWEDWTEDKKPVRFGLKFKPEKPINPLKPVKHFWAFIVWNYQSKDVQIMQITQSTIQTAIQNLTKDEDWGSPFDYDIKIIKTGKDKETKYSVNPSPKKPLTEEQTKSALAKRVNLNALYANADPYAISDTVTELYFEGLPF